MAQALALGALAEGSTSPNPRVGCLVVRDGHVVGRGFHRAPGQPHAEALALADAGERAHGATVFVSLEPCAHHGRTPPCSDLLIESGVQRVVAAVQDPNPLVDGRGFAALRDAGIGVDVGCLAGEAEALNDAFFFHHRSGRPLVTLKAALSLDGMIAAAGGRSKWITGPAARRFAHRLRLRHDAVLVGAGTLRADDPRLTVRLDGIEAPRHRAVISESLDLDPGARLFDGAAPGPRPRVYTSEDAPASHEARLAPCADIVRLGRVSGQLDLRAMLADLSRCGVHGLLVEGGAGTHAAFLDQRLADRGALFHSQKLFGARGATPLLDRQTVAAPLAGWTLFRRRQIPLGEDILVVGHLASPEDSGARDGTSCSPD